MLYESLKTVVSHFEMSNRSLLVAAMEILEMTKGLHLISWCATRMAHFLQACLRFNELLVPVYTSMYSSDLKKEDRDALFTAENIYTMKVICGVEKAMYGAYLRAVDKSVNLVSMTYNIAHNSADKVRDVTTTEADKFLLPNSEEVQALPRLRHTAGADAQLHRLLFIALRSLSKQAERTVP